MSDFLTNASSPIRILIIVGVVMGAHLAVVGLHRLSRKLMASRVGSAFSKARTIVSIAGSVAVFAVYFGALGMVLKEFGVSLTAYLASASIIGLALGFGSQGLVQDVVTGLTLVFSNLLDVGDMVGLRMTFSLSAETLFADAQFRHCAQTDQGALMGFQFLGLGQSIEGKNALRIIAGKVSEYQRLELRHRAPV